MDVPGDEGVFRVESAEIFDQTRQSNLRSRLQNRNRLSGSDLQTPEHPNVDRQVAIDFSGVTTLSSANLGGLVRANREAREMEYSVVLVNVGDSIREILALTRLDRLFASIGTEQLIDTEKSVDQTTRVDEVVIA